MRKKIPEIWLFSLTCSSPSEFIEAGDAARATGTRGGFGRAISLYHLALNALNQVPSSFIANEPDFYLSRGRIYNKIGECLVELGRKAQAGEFFEHAVLEFEEGGAILEELVLEEPNAAEGLAQLGLGLGRSFLNLSQLSLMNSCQERDNLWLAVESYSLALEHARPFSHLASAAALGLGDSYLRMGQLDLAVQNYSLAITSSPRSFHAARALAALKTIQASIPRN